MDAQQFLAEFGHIANAPGGVARLRELVIYLAVFGKLLADPPSTISEDAHSLLNTVGREMLKLIESGEAKRSVPLLPLSGLEVAMYPGHWAATRLGAAIHLVSGQHLGPHEQNTSRDGIPYLTGASDFGEVNPVVSRWTHERRAVAVRGDILIAVKGTIGTINFLDLDEAAIGRQLMAIRPLAVEPRFLALVLRRNENHFLAQSIGIAIPGISRDDIRQLPTGIPPLEEQSRIVTQVDELMALCDKLEAQQQERRKLQNALRQSTLQAVAVATSPHELQFTWSRLAENFEQLFHAPEDVAELRNVVFDLALRGALLQTTSAAKANESEHDDMPPLPEGWQWKTLDELSEYITSGSRGWRGYLATSGDAFIRSQDIKHDALVFENPAFVALPDKAEGKRTLVRQGDLLLTITGGNVGKCAPVPTLPHRAYVSQHVALIRLRDSRLAELVHFWMINAYGARRFLSRYIYGDKPGLNLTQVGSVPVPIPPETVRSQILDDLRSHQAICDRFAALVKTKQALAKTLASATVASLTGIAIEQGEEKPVKAPQTELIAPLRLGQAPDVKAQAPLATMLARHKGEMSANDLRQRFGGEIDAFYAQLKTEVARGWIQEPVVAEMRERLTDKADA